MTDEIDNDGMEVIEEAQAATEIPNVDIAMGSFDLDLPVNFKPRKYQLQCFELAKKQNVFAVLDTGSGKTFIAVMLIKYISNQVYQAYKGMKGDSQLMVAGQSDSPRKKLIFFLVNSVPLVFQQSSVLRSQTSLRVGHYCGEMNVDLWGENQWKLIFDKLDVLVLTAQILLDLLVHGFIKMDQIALLIFDECHHARKRHPYNVIMSDFYYKIDREYRPKIFGMTASPVNRKEDVNQSVWQLEKNLDCQAFTVSRTEDPQLLEAAPKPVEKLVFYPSTPIDFVVPGPRLQKLIILGSEVNSPLLQLKSKLEVLVSELGPWAAEQLLYAKLRQFSQSNLQLLDLDPTADRQSAITYLKHLSVSLSQFAAPEYDPKLLSPKVLRLIKVLKKLAPSFQNFCCIIFAQKRLCAYALQEILVQCPDLKDIVRPKVLVGHGSKTQKLMDDKMKSKMQNQVVKDFAQGESNVLISTSVAEEGLDVQPCSCVIRFDLCHTLSAYIQSRGRARHKDSQFLIFIEDGNMEHRTVMNRIKMAEKDFSQWQLLDTYGEGEEGDDGDDDDVDGDNENARWIDASSNEVFTVESSGACVSYNSSVTTLHYYCATLSHTDNIIRKAEFQFVGVSDQVIYQMEAILPPGAPFKTMKGNLMPSKTLAKRSAALEAVKKLYQVGALDDHLLPFRFEIDNYKQDRYDFHHLLDGMQMDQDLLPGEMGIKRDIEWTLKLPWTDQKWFDSAEDVDKDKTSLDQPAVVVDDLELDLYCSRFSWSSEFSGHLPIALITREKMPEVFTFPIYSQSHGVLDEPGELSMNQSVAVRLKLSEVKRLQRFNSFIMRYVFLSHRDEMDTSGNEPNYIWDKTDFEQWDESYRYLWAPIEQQSDQVDWAYIDKVFSYESAFKSCGRPDFISVLDYIKEQQIIDSAEGDTALISEEWVATDLMDYQKRVVIDKILYDLNPLSGIMKEDLLDKGVILKADGDYGNTYLDWYKKTHKRIPYTRRRLPHIREDQPLCKVYRAPLMRNYLVPVIDPENLNVKDKSKLPQHRIPQFFIFCPIPAPLFRSAAMFPSIIARIESISLALNFQQDFNLQEIPIHLLLEALTAPATNLGYSYECLETIGDAFLKIAVSLDLFCKHLDKDEGKLSYARHLIVSNKALYKKAKALSLPQYIWISPVSPKSYRLPMQSDVVAKVVSITGFNKHHRHKVVEANCISDATVSDVVESLLGAAYVHGGVSMAMQMMIKLGFEMLQPQWPLYKELLIDQYKDKDYHPRTIPVTIENVIGRQFGNLRLLDESLNHPSSQIEGLPNYQRLEFLGDAILDLVVASELFWLCRDREQYGKEFPKFIPPLALIPPSIRSKLEKRGIPLDPGRLTDVKMLVVNNETLGFVCIARQLSKNIIHFSEPLFAQLSSSTRYVNEVLAMDRAQWVEETSHIDQLPWWWWVNAFDAKSELSVTDKQTQSLLVVDMPIHNSNSHLEQQSSEDIVPDSLDDGFVDDDQEDEQEDEQKHQVGEEGITDEIITTTAVEKEQSVDLLAQSMQAVTLQNADQQSDDNRQLISMELACQLVSNKWPKDPHTIPKGVSDVLEAVIGAVFIDCGFDYDAVAKVIDNIIGINDGHRPDATHSDETVLPEEVLEVDSAKAALPVLDKQTESEDNEHQDEEIQSTALEPQVVQIDRLMSLKKWVLEHSHEAMYVRMHPLKKLNQLIDSRQCSALVIKQFPFMRSINALDQQIMKQTMNDGASSSKQQNGNRPGKETEFSRDLMSLEFADQHVTESYFTCLTVGVYLHGILLGISQGPNYKSCRVVAARSALRSLDAIRYHLSQVGDDERINAMGHDFNLDYGVPCQICQRENTLRKRGTYQ
ncbi:hypothetical protein MP228_001863 [Amoeboaphelidium protococcarum]|nr:hypothetical protein MP228_001863 [Amoeboaphelidium protococcarum]